MIIPVAQPIQQRRRLMARPHQLEAVDAIVEELKEASRTTAVMACGTGKTAVGLWVAERVCGENAIILCLFPSLALVRQTIEVWQDNHNWGRLFRFTAVCSDSSVVDDDERPEDMPFSVTTSAEEVARFITAGEGIRAIFATYHSSPVVADAVNITESHFDFALFDEAHRTAGSPDSAFAVALDDDLVSSRKRLFMTATPRVTQRRHGEHGKRARTVSMADQVLYGRVSHRLSFGEAADRGIICRYKVLVSTVSRSELVGQFTGVADIREAMHRVSLAKAVAKVGARKIISFHPTVLGARIFAEGAGHIGTHLTDYEVVHVNGSLPARERGDRMLRFGIAPKAVATNARCLTEGVDVPAVDLVAFMGAKNSMIDIAQAVGRALRKSDETGKEVGYILLPLLIEAEDAERPEDAAARADMGNLWTVLTTLMDMDDTLAEVFAMAVRDYSHDGQSPTDFLHDFIEIIGEEANAIRRAVEVVALEELGQAFDYGLGKLLRYVEREGHADVPKGHVEDGFTLATWVYNRRQDFRRGALDPEQVAALDAVPGWHWNRHEGRWQEGLAAVAAYLLQFGHLKIPKDYRVGRMRLVQWVNDRREEYRDGVLSSARIAALEAIPGWTWFPYDAAFSRGLEALRRFAEREGHTLVPGDYREEGFALGTFLRAKRERYRAGRLSPEQESQLAAVPGWVWRVLPKQFENGLASLRRFVDEHGHTRVPVGYVQDGVKLQVWVSNRRRDYKGGILSAAQVQELEGVPGWTWNALEGRFAKAYEGLRKFAERTGHSQPPKGNNYCGVDLNKWVIDQRINYHNGSLSADKIAVLERLPGWTWSPAEDLFLENLEAIRRYVATYGHSQVPIDYQIDGIRLGLRVSGCRRSYRRGRLSADKIAILESLPGWTWSPLDDAFSEGLAALRRYIVRYGHPGVPASYQIDGIRLGNWVANRRNDFKRGALSAERIVVLEALPGWQWERRGRAKGTQ